MYHHYWQCNNNNNKTYKKANAFKMIGKWEGITAAATAARTEYCKITSFFFFAFSFYGFCFLLLCITFAFASNDSLMTFKPIQPGLPFTHSTEYGVDVKTKVRIEFHLCIQYFFPVLEKSRRHILGVMMTLKSSFGCKRKEWVWVCIDRPHICVCVYLFTNTRLPQMHTHCALNKH